jgi:hypothetical protein
MPSIAWTTVIAQSASVQRAPMAYRVPPSWQENNRMKHFLILAGMCIAASLIAPVVVTAEEHHAEKRYYDRNGRDYHYWNDGEDRQYRAYVVEQHRQYVPFVRVRPRERQEYFRYRHEHGFKVEVR